MAREYARYLTSTHDDADWRSLTTTQHDCYMAILSSDAISWAGVAPYVPSRYVLAADLTEKRVTKTWAELESAGLLVIDHTTGEVLVRTFIRHENVLAKPNLTKATIAAIGRVRSERLRECITGLLRQLFLGKPNLAGWQQFAERMPELFQELSPEQFAERMPNHLSKSQSYKVTKTNRHLANASPDHDSAANGKQALANLANDLDLEAPR